MTDEIKIISKSIDNRKGEVLSSLKSSGINVNPNSSKEELLGIIISQVRKGNGYLVYNLGEVINKDLEKKSNLLPIAAGLILTTGSTIIGKIGGFFGGSVDKDAERAADLSRQQSIRAEAEMVRKMQIAASKAQAKKIASETKEKERKSKIKRTIITLSVIGGALIIGTIVTVLILKK